MLVNQKKYDIMFKARVCKMKNVLAFVDEYRANKGKGGIYTYDEVKQIPRFKEDISIYYKQSIGNLLKEALKKWEEDKMQITIERY